MPNFIGRSTFYIEEKRVYQEQSNERALKLVDDEAIEKLSKIDHCFE